MELKVYSKETQTRQQEPKSSAHRFQSQCGLRKLWTIAVMPEGRAVVAEGTSARWTVCCRKAANAAQFHACHRSVSI